MRETQMADMRIDDIDRQSVVEHAMVNNSEEIHEIGGNVVNFMSAPFLARATLRTKSFMEGYSSQAAGKASSLFKHSLRLFPSKDLGPRQT